MLAMLSDDLSREERANEAIYFVRRFFETWSGALKESAKQSAYWKLAPLVRKIPLWRPSKHPPGGQRWTSPSMTRWPCSWTPSSPSTARRPP